MVIILSATQREILNFIVEIYDPEMHGVLDLNTIISATGISEQIVREDLLYMRTNALITLSSAKIYSYTSKGKALL